MHYNPSRTIFSLFLSILTLLALFLILPNHAQAEEPSRVPDACTDIFFSEYIEGSSQNKALELFNGTGADIDLSAYVLERYSNGSSTAATVALSGTVTDGDVFVAAHSSSATEIQDEADMLSGSISHNGDDAWVLKKGTVVIDSIGQVGFDPGSEWGSGDASTKDNTIRRKVTIDTGDTDPTNAYDPAPEWDGFATNTFDGLGSHTANGCAAPTAAPLLITEVVVKPTAGEFVEIYNPNAAAVDLSDIYLTDATYAGGSTYYYNIVTGANFGGGGFNDFHARFPNGAMIGAGEYQTISLNGSDAFSTTYGTSPTYELFEDGGSADSVPDMREAVTGSIASDSGLTNSGEVVILYKWDGAGDLVSDLDYIVWGDTNEAVDKTGISVDGPDADVVTTTYQADTALTSQELVSAGAHPNGKSWQREDLTEGTETSSGGNGTTGHDETSENLATTFCENTPTPNAVTVCPTVPTTVTITTIPAIQGNGAASTFDGMIVTTVGVVTVDYQDGTFNGFYIQDATGDGDVTTSDGIFVYEGSSTVDVSVGDLLTVTGTVDEFHDFTEITGSIVISNGGSTTPIAPTKIMLPLASAATFEQYEGMLIEFDQTLFVTEHYNMARYGEVLLSPNDRVFQFTHVMSPTVAGYTQHQADVARGTITLDDAISTQNPDPVVYPAPTGLGAANTLRGGDSTDNLVGALHYSFGQYKLQPADLSALPSFTVNNPRPANLTTPTDNIAVAAFNALNFFTTVDPGGNTGCGPSGTSGCRGADNAAELTRQRDKLLAALLGMDADVIGLMEVENPDATIAASADPQLQSLVSGMNAVAGAGTYAFIETGSIGTDAIRVAFLYNTTTITPTGAFAVLDSSVDATFNDTKNRPALAQTFIDASSGSSFTVVVNHLKSKGSDCSSTGIPNDDDTTTGQGNCNITRTNAATAIANWMATDPTSSGNSDILIIGDLNSYRMEDPITALKDAGYSDLGSSSSRAGEPYSYVFRGQWGYLDYAMASTSIQSKVTNTTVWHINADEPRALDYNTEFKSAGQVTGFYANDTYRASDHDPIIVTLNMGSELAVTMLDANAPISASPIILLVVLVATLGFASIYILRKRA